jgi:diaminohydroxyphosphoribosylaminopyrimidine deaminase/5-amino-6-(5-phosphoribosylamino)uracil reductase
MRHALRLARRGWGHTAPNPMVGAVVVQGDTVVGEGWHARFGADHAEVAALAAAGERARGATVYVTLEPCNHHGKTPPCTDALLAARVRRVVAAAADPSAVASGGLARLAAAGVDVSSGVEAAAARELNAPFFHAIGSDRPWITLKLALSLDGALADGTRRPGWLTNARSRREVHRLRANADAVAVGIGTALADDPALTVRDVAPPRVPPARVVFDRTLRLPPGSRLARTAREQPVLVVCDDPPPDRARALEQLGVVLVRASTAPDAMRLLRAAHGVRALLVEGGAGLASVLWDAALVDRLVIFQAPVVLGAGALHAFSLAAGVRASDATRLRVVERRRLGDDHMTIYALPAI